jgi:hypothetical protein
VNRPNIVGGTRVTHLQDFAINATRSSNYSEPSLAWDRATNAYNTSSVRTQLGAVNGSSDRDGNLHMNITSVLSKVHQMAAILLPGAGVIFEDGRPF